jgi:hypothetical protein
VRCLALHRMNVVCAAGGDGPIVASAPCQHLAWGVLSSRKNAVARVRPSARYGHRPRPFDSASVNLVDTTFGRDQTSWMSWWNQYSQGSCSVRRHVARASLSFLYLAFTRERIFDRIVPGTVQV